MNVGDAKDPKHPWPARPNEDKPCTFPDGTASIHLGLVKCAHMHAPSARGDWTGLIYEDQDDVYVYSLPLSFAIRDQVH